MFDSCKSCGSKSVVGVEYSYDSKNHYDGISEIMCNDCGARYGRWSGKRLEGNEEEKPFGGR